MVMMDAALPPAVSALARLDADAAAHQLLLQLRSNADAAAGPDEDARSSRASLLAEVLGLPDHRHDARSAILVDFAACVLTLCGELDLGPQQTVAVLRIGQQLLEGCAAGATRAEAQGLLRGALLQLCTASGSRAPPAPAAAAEPPVADTAAQEQPSAGAAASEPCMLPPDVIGQIAAGFTTTLLQHYSLYRCVFTAPQQHVEHAHHLMVETPVVPPALHQALSEADCQAHLAAEAAALAAAQAAAAAEEAAAREAEQAAVLAQAQAAEAAARAEQLQRKPKTLDEAVEKLVALRLEEVRLATAADHAGQTAALSARVGHLEQQAALLQQLQSSSGAPSKGSRVASARPVAAT